jgi:hypothetical protein
VITITGLGVHDAPESPFKLTGMRISRACHPPLHGIGQSHDV